MDIDSSVAIDMKPIQNEILDFYCDRNLELICRVCLERIQNDGKGCNIFETTKSVHLPTMIMACASVQIADGDGLPSTICGSCVAKLHIAWQFKLLCENSDLKLRQYYMNQHSKQLGHSFDIILTKGESYSIKCEDAYGHSHISKSSKQPELGLEIEVVKNMKNLRKSRKTQNLKEQKTHQCDTCGKTFNRREYLTQHIRIHTGEKPYRCHLCEKRFINSGHLITHMRTHTGEKPHACTLCPKAFSTKQELQKHTMVHNGVRPFLCKMCGRSFGSSSNLYSHLKHHTGEKNFTCEYCSKSFYTKQELKQHLVVHTGEKAFTCQLCNKKFSQIAHLKRHSKLHT